MQSLRHITIATITLLSLTVTAVAQSGLTPAQSLTDSNNAAVNRSDVGRDPAYLPKEVDGYTHPHEDGSLTLRVPEQVKQGISPDFLTNPDGMVSTLQIMLILTVLTLSPAIVMMTTSFVRILVVLSILRQALGIAQLPPSQVLTALSLFMTLLIMTPTWSEVYSEAILPYSERTISLEEAYKKGELPIRRFMANQIDQTQNTDDVLMFMSYIRDTDGNPLPEPESWREVPWRALLPAYMLSELKTAFLIGFQIFLPFLILDMVVSSVMVSMGMMMLPPVIISLPFKLMLFVLMDGWRLVVVMLMDTFVF
ncbi:MAG: flagellar type III secretion system pore protein FliP [Planctomycetaceae bacterium]|jgi:flagellar biosynthetic protein FliP|nr:flagellar type III secretion system pore protein FliP [Planctomycetaceae bacterium]